MTIALITGADKGIGHESARLLGARDEERGRAAARRLGQPYLALDVTDAASVAAAARRLRDEYGGLDILVNNAAVAGVRRGASPSATALADLREVYETNVFGVVAVTNAMLPLLRQSPAARIVNVSSELGSLGLATDPGSPFWARNNLIYNSSKSALNMVTVAYAKELVDTPIKVNAASPGYCATDMTAHRGPRSAEQGAAIVVRLATLDADGPTGAFLADEGAVPW
ncbi:SDR family NAD(P)-dependent oxidoreductase [Nonomuraea longicatena]|uniref:SDR family NAD(P)-dependent oxidoreductase n=1 Tax=Nonomuraea longicatena TaxID=83682 RepID=A0ABP3Z2G0_9ACTN